MLVHKKRTMHFVCNECGVKFTHKVVLNGILISFFLLESFQIDSKNYRKTFVFAGEYEAALGRTF